MSAVMKDIGPVSKDQFNTHQKFKFRGIDQFVNALHPALVKHGVFMTPECVSSTSELHQVTRSSGSAGVDKHVALLMKFHFYAEDGSSVTVGPIPAEGLDGGDKATNKALSAALKYALIQTLSVPTEDMEEADKESPTLSRPKATQTSSPTQTATPSAALTTSAPASDAAGGSPKTASSFRKPKSAPLSNGNGTSSGATTALVNEDGWV